MQSVTAENCRKTFTEEESNKRNRVHREREACFCTEWQAGDTESKCMTRKSTNDAVLPDMSSISHSSDKTSAPRLPRQSLGMLRLPS